MQVQPATRTVSASGELSLRQALLGNATFYSGDEVLVQFDLTLEQDREQVDLAWLEPTSGWHLDSADIIGLKKQTVRGRPIGVGNLKEFLNKLFSQDAKFHPTPFKARHSIILRFVD